MSVYYTSAHPKTIVALMETGRLPENLPDYVEPKAIALYEKPADCLPTRESRLFHQTFVLELKLPFKAKKNITISHLDTAWIERVLLYSQTAQKLLQRLFKGHIPKPVELKETEERVYLDVPFEEKEAARELGARWDSQSRQWYARASQDGILSLWPKNPPPLAQLIGEDRNFSGYGWRNFLDVPFAEKSHAKQMGAFWDPCFKKWYAPEGQEHLLQIWPLKSTKSLANRLFVDLIPSTCWFTNVRSCVLPADWNRLRKFVYERAGNQCECCLEKNCRLDAHERWHYDTMRKVQKLMRVIALCQNCHAATHIGFAWRQGHREEAFNHLMLVTGMNREQAEWHIEDAFARCEERDQTLWELDLSIITDSGIALIEKPESYERENLALKGLKRARDEEAILESPQKRARQQPPNEPQESFFAFLRRMFGW